MKISKLLYNHGPVINIKDVVVRYTDNPEFDFSWGVRKAGCIIEVDTKNDIKSKPIEKDNR